MAEGIGMLPVLLRHLVPSLLKYSLELAGEVLTINLFFEFLCV
jgi:hypothetical protein